jgi:hypothetical protein
MHRCLLIALAVAAPVLAQKYDGPRPPKEDIPYLVHADNLLATEANEAKQENRKKEIYYVIPGASSTARTPLASPVFLLLSGDVQADRMQLYKLTSKGGQRELLFNHNSKTIAHPYRLNVKNLESNLYRIEVDEILENGEYSLTPEGSNQVFCFQVY